MTVFKRLAPTGSEINFELFLVNNFYYTILKNIILFCRMD